ncbi:MAG: rod shape-determining protein MreC [Eubacterium sp.]|nr:rod shape-determining protein MreC [Eubacterium sp.]
MKFNYKKDISPKYLLLGLSLICMLLLGISLFSESALEKTRILFGKVFIPLQEGASAIGEWTAERFQVFGDVKELREENDKLKERNRELEDAIARNQAELSELSELRRLYQLDQMYPEYNTTAARVFSVDSSGWFNEFYINKGLNDGIYEDCNVLYDGGLLGIVVESYADYSRVRAIVDDRSRIMAEIGPNGTLCTVEGSLTTYADGYILATDIDKDGNISVGDTVLTSNVSDRFLYGLTIGYVKEIYNDPNNLTVTAKIKTAVDFRNVRDVLVITDRKQEVTY